MLFRGTTHLPYICTALGQHNNGCAPILPKLPSAGLLGDDFPEGSPPLPTNQRLSKGGFLLYSSRHGN
ncbi:hypothetical protein RKD55_002234 [Rossellomorea marisflavi]